MQDAHWEEGYEAGWKDCCFITDELVSGLLEDVELQSALADRLRAELAKAVGHAAAVAAP